jgi:hypothetical protein
MPELQDTYEVKPGDTLSKIAQHFGIGLSDLLKANQQITNPNLIVVGQKINIPSSGAEPHNTAADGHGEVYDGIHPAPATISTNRANYVNAPLTNAPGQRDPNTYSQVINQFAVGNNPRYKPGHGDTFCNIFVWDVSRAMGAEVAHWVDAHGGIAAPFVPGAHEININGGVDWMKTHGVEEHGWKSVSSAEAQAAANQGRLAVVLWKNMTGGHGHTAIIRPGELTAAGPASAQAGAHNFNLGHVVNGFGSHSGLLYFSHD